MPYQIAIRTYFSASLKKLYFGRGSLEEIIFMISAYRVGSTV